MPGRLSWCTKSVFKMDVWKRVFGHASIPCPSRPWKCEAVSFQLPTIQKAENSVWTSWQQHVSGLPIFVSPPLCSMLEAVWTIQQEGRLSHSLALLVCLLHTHRKYSEA